jgi:hypothetical protein
MRTQAAIGANVTLDDGVICLGDLSDASAQVITYAPPLHLLC